MRIQNETLFEDFGVHYYPGTMRSFVTIEMGPGDGHATLYLHDLGDCDKLIAAAVEAKSMLLVGAVADLTAGDDAGHAIAADLDDPVRAPLPDAEPVRAPLPDEADPPVCTASRIGFGGCVRTPYHPGWHRNADAAGWPQYDEDIELDAALTADGYQLPAATVAR